MAERVLAAVLAGTTASPRVEPPEPLLPYLRFRKLPTAAVAVVRRVLDDDADLRERMAEALGDLDAVGTLYLRRPEGWDDVLASMAAPGPAVEVDDGALRREERRRMAAEDARARAEDEVSALRAALAQARDDADAARGRERAVAAELAEARRARRAAEDEAAASGRLRAAAEDDLADAHALARRLRLEAGSRPTGTVDLDDLAATLHRATEASAGLAADVAARLDDLRARLGAAAAAVARAEESEPVEGPPSPGRSPVPPPPGLADDDPRAVAALLRVADLVVLVDGYNVTIGAWGSLALADQRARLVRQCEIAAARTGAEVRVVFDGAEPAAIPQGRRSLVQVQFSPAGVEADDVIIGLAEGIPATRPVAVVSDDHRVRRGAVAAGANVVAAVAFLTAADATP